MIVIFPLGCASVSVTWGPKQELPPTSIPPTFVRIVVTPKPTETPTPTATSVPTVQPASLDDGPPEFPLSVDPELVEDKPEDSIIFQRWSEYLTNTKIKRSENDVPTHFCSDGTVMRDDRLHESIENWRISRSPAVASWDWGTVNVAVDVYSGRWAGREWYMLTLVRKGGEVFVTNNPFPAKLHIERSELCLLQL